MNTAGRAAFLVGLSLSAVAGDVIAGEQANAEERICADAIRAEESQRAYPADLLIAIALVESGRFNARRRANTPWPWTVTAGGRGRFFASRAAAAAAVRGLRARGIESIDVGCMQVNLYYHADAFTSVDDALDPQLNVAYAASFLTDLAMQTGSWIAAVGRYHSGTAINARRYRAKVLAARAARRRARDPLAASGSALPLETGEPLLTDAPAASDLPSVLRGSKTTQSPGRVFAPGRVVLPIILRGNRDGDPKR